MRGAGPRPRREVNQQLGLELPEDADFDTIGGFVFSELGHIPVAGEELVWHNVRITVLEATRRRIERVRIEVLDGGAEGVGRFRGRGVSGFRGRNMRCDHDAGIALGRRGFTQRHVHSTAPR